MSYGDDEQRRNAPATASIVPNLFLRGALGWR